MEFLAVWNTLALVASVDHESAHLRITGASTKRHPGATKQTSSYNIRAISQYSHCIRATGAAAYCLLRA